MSEARKLRNTAAISIGVYWAFCVAVIWVLHYIDPWDGSYAYSLNKTLEYSAGCSIALAIFYIFSLFIKEPAPADDKDTIIDEPNYGIDPETEKKYRASIDKRLHPTPDPFDISDMD